MTQLSNLVKNGATLQVKASIAALAVGDMVQIGGPGLKAFPIKTLDYAKTSPITTLLAQTSVKASAAPGYDRQAAVMDAAGNIYVGSGAQVFKYSPLGVLIWGALIVSAATTPLGMKLIMLSNGNIAAISADSSNGNISFSIFEANSNLIVSQTAVATGNNSSSKTYFDACALSGGGFAVSYLNSALTQIALQTYDNTGTAVLAATNVQAFGTNLIYNRMAQLTSGNLLLAFKSASTAPTGTSFVVVTTSGVSVKTNTVSDSDGAGTPFLSISVMAGGFFAVASGGTSAHKVSVYNDAGALQGGAFTSSADATTTSVFMAFKILNDGASFWFVWMAIGTGIVKLAKILTSGTGFFTTSIAAMGSTNGMDAAINTGFVVVFKGSDNSLVGSYVAIALPDAELPSVNPVAFGAVGNVGSAAATVGTVWPRVLFPGDFTAVFVYDQQNVAGTFLSIVKFAASAILGVAQTAVTANSPGTPGSPTLVTINDGPGGYLTNAATGTNGTVFDHLATTPAGNKGTLYTNSIAMKGI